MQTGPPEVKRTEHASDRNIATDVRAVDLPAALPVEEIPTIFAVGDVHGRYDLLKRLMLAIEKECEQNLLSDAKPHIIFLGDYVDRGFQSKNVIDALMDLQKRAEFETVFLKGNHEEVLQAFLRDPSVGRQWSNFGGRETLISYGVTPPRDINNGDDWRRAQREFKNKIPEAHVEFLQSLVTFYQIGPYGFVHAGVKSGVPFADQSDNDRLWIRGEFLNAKNREDLFIIHGHSPVDIPYVDHRRINVDTGSYYSGRLTAVKLTTGSAVFFTI